MSEKYNDIFNAELQQQIEGKLPANHTYKLGMAGAILQSTGIQALPIELRASRLKNKSMQKNHPFPLKHIKNLPKALQNPIMVFDSATVLGRKVILTELQNRGNNFIVALGTIFKGNRIQVNDIRSIYPKDYIQGIIDWINAGDLLRYVNKNKALNWISQQRSNSAEVAKSVKNLIYATKVLQNFENSKNNTDMKEKTLFGLFGSQKSENEIPSEIKTALKFDIANYASDDPIRKNLLGIYHENGFKVATDAHIMVKIKEDYPKEKEGKAYYAKEKMAKKAFEFENRGEILTEDVLQKLMNNPIDAQYVYYQVVLDDAIKKAINPHKLDIEKLMTEAVVVLKMEQIAKLIKWETNAELIGSVLRYPVKIKDVTFRADYLKLFLSACNQIGAKEFYVQKQTFFAKTVKGCVLAMGLIDANNETKTQPSDDFYLFENPIPLKKVLSELQAIFENKKESMKYEDVNACKKRFAEIEKILSWLEVSCIATQPSDSSDKIKKLKQMKKRLELLKEAMKSSK